MNAMLRAMIQHEESINNAKDYDDYVRGYNADPMDIDLDKESEAFHAGHIQQELDEIYIAGLKPKWVKRIYQKYHEII